MTADAECNKKATQSETKKSETRQSQARQGKKDDLLFQLHVRSIKKELRQLACNVLHFSQQRTMQISCELHTI